MMTKKQAVLATIPSDSHSWNLVFMQLFLEEQGFEVLNLGSCTSFDKITEACLEHEPCLTLISTLNGLGCEEGKKLSNLINDLPFRRHTKLVIGGNLGIDQKKQADHAADLMESGFDAAFYGPDSLQSFLEFVDEFLFTEAAEEIATIYKPVKYDEHRKRIPSRPWPAIPRNGYRAVRKCLTEISSS